MPIPAKAQINSCKPSVADFINTICQKATFPVWSKKKEAAELGGLSFYKQEILDRLEVIADTDLHNVHL